MTHLPPANTPAAEDCLVVELRQYTLRPGQRDVLVDLFERAFVETQEAAGMRVLGQFRDLDDADRFVWLRGFRSMDARAQALAAFYGGPVWAAHRDAANATMLDSDNVLLLRLAWSGAGIGALPRRADAAAAAGGGAAQPARGVLRATVLHLTQPAQAELLAFCRAHWSALLHGAGARSLAWYVTEPAENNFPRLPVRQGEQVVLSLAMFEDQATCARFGRVWADDLLPALAPWLLGPAQVLALAPTARSAMHA
jgi:hypothetical protein